MHFSMSTLVTFQGESLQVLLSLQVQCGLSGIIDCFMKKKEEHWMIKETQSAEYYILCVK